MLIEEYDGKKYKAVPLATEVELLFQCGKCDLYDSCETNAIRDRFPYACQPHEREDNQDVYFVEVENV